MYYFDLIDYKFGNYKKNAYLCSVKMKEADAVQERRNRRHGDNEIINPNLNFFNSFLQ